MSMHPLLVRTGALLAGLALLVPAVAAGDDLQRAQVVDGMNVYLGVMSAAAIRARPNLVAEERMHGGIPAGKDLYHVLVTLYDRATGSRIEHAEVHADVRPLGLSGTERDLEVMHSGGVPSYCAYFHMSSGETYRVLVSIARPGTTRVAHTQFVYTP